MWPYPERRGGNETCPEDVDLGGGQLVDGPGIRLRGAGLEHPLGVSVGVDVVPPPEADHEPARDVLHGPEVQGEQQNYAYEAPNEAVRIPATKQVNWNGNEDVKIIEASLCILTN